MASKPLTLILAGTPVKVTSEIVPVDKVRLNPENPRIRFLLQQKGLSKSPAELALVDIIRDQPGYDGLQKAIRKAGGIYDPIIISHDGLVVEGNTRAAVFKVLKKGNPADKRWKEIPVQRLPKNVSASALALLMASYHVGGKTVWRAYAKADHIYQLKKVYGLTAEQIADETRMTTKEIEQNIAAYEYLVKEVLPEAKGAKGNEILEKKFSHALELFKNKKLDTHRKDPKFRKHVAKLIVTDRIKGAEVRDLDKVMKNRQATAALKKDGFKAAKIVLTEADPTAGSKILKEVRHLTASLSSMSQTDLELIKKSQKARDMLINLHAEVKNVASITGTKLKG